MLLNVILWLALAYLLIVVIWRFFGSRKGRPEQTRKATSDSLARKLFGRGWVVPGFVVVLACATLVAKYHTILFGPSWSDEERAQVAHFREAIKLYDQAVQITDAGGLVTNDWETVNALLEASLAEAEQVGDSILHKLHPEFKAIYFSRLVSGLHAGTFGLRYFNEPSKKVDSTAQQIRDDSLRVGRILFKAWNDWFDPRRADIMKLIE